MFLRAIHCLMYDYNAKTQRFNEKRVLQVNRDRMVLASKTVVGYLGKEKSPSGIQFSSVI